MEANSDCFHRTPQKKLQSCWQSLISVILKYYKPMKNSWSLNLLIFHLFEAIQQNSIPKSFAECRNQPTPNWTEIILTVCYYHVTYAFQSESILYSCLNAKKLLARNRRDIWNLGDSNGIKSHNHLVRKRMLNHLAKLSWVFVYELSG